MHRIRMLKNSLIDGNKSVSVFSYARITVDCESFGNRVKQTVELLLCVL